jgi:hypothetical protein
MPLEPLDVIEVLVAPRGSLVPEQRLPANDRYDAAVDVGKKGRAGGFVEGYAADLGEHFDAQRLQADTISRAFVVERGGVDTVRPDRRPEDRECREDFGRICWSRTHEDIEIFRRARSPVDGHRPATDQDEVCSFVGKCDEDVSKVVWKLKLRHAWEGRFVPEAKRVPRGRKAEAAVRSPTKQRGTAGSWP